MDDSWDDWLEKDWLEEIRRITFRQVMKFVYLGSVFLLGVGLLIITFYFFAVLASNPSFRLPGELSRVSGMSPLLIFGFKFIYGSIPLIRSRRRIWAVPSFVLSFYIVVAYLLFLMYEFDVTQLFEIFLGLFTMEYIAFHIVNLYILSLAAAAGVEGLLLLKKGGEVFQAVSFVTRVLLNNYLGANLLVLGWSFHLIMHE